MTKKVLILGGGYAGVEAALTLSKKKKKEKIEITLIDKNNYHTLLTELHEVAGNRIGEDGIIVPFDRIFKYTDVNYVKDEIIEYDFANKTLKSENNSYSYDYLVLAMGSKPNYYGIEGLDEHAFTLWSYDDAVKIREHIIECFVNARQETNPDERKKLLTFVVAGAGFTGVEMIGELGIWVKKLCKEYGFKRDDVRLMVVDLLPRVLNVLSEKNSKKTHDYLEKKLKVEVLLNSNISDVDSEGFMSSTGYVPCKTLIWACGVCAVDDVAKLEVETVQGRRIAVDEYCRTAHEGVYAVGDISGFKGDQEIPYPAMVENAIQTAHGVGLNIINEIKGKDLKPVKVKMHGVMVSVGNYFAVSEVMGKSFPSWISIFLKFMVNIHYLWEIAGFHGISKYLYHEILERKQSKNIIEKHYSTRMQAWWLVLLRMFLGFMWLKEGLGKVADGWLERVKLFAYFRDSDAFYEYIINPDSTSDAVTAATGLVEGDVVFKLDWGWLNVIIVNAGEIAMKVEFFLMNWMKDNVLLSSADSMLAFQWFVVIAQILVGLGLIAGAFNFLSAGMSIVLLSSFFMTTGLFMNSQWWMFFASIAVLGGAGRAFGLDHYIIPYLNNFWEKIWKTRKFNPFFKRALDRNNDK